MGEGVFCVAVPECINCCPFYHVGSRGDPVPTRCPLLLFLARITRYAAQQDRFENEAETVSGSAQPA